MNKRSFRPFALVAGLVSVAAGLAYGDSIPPAAADSIAMVSAEWTSEFGLQERTLATTGRNPYFILEPGFRLTLQNEIDRLQITVLDDTVQIGDFMTRVVEEREWSEGELVEISRNFFAICTETGDVFYFGEEVDIYKEDEVVDHGGAWLAYRDGAKPGMAMPGRPVLGAMYYQEIAPEVAMDRAKVKSLTDSLSTPAGTFKECLQTEESSALHPDEWEFKTYAPGIGLIQDEDLLLVQQGLIKK